MPDFEHNRDDASVIRDFPFSRSKPPDSSITDGILPLLDNIFKHFSLLTSLTSPEPGFMLVRSGGMGNRHEIRYVSGRR